MLMSKYRVINFSGVPYGTPDEMRAGRKAYIDRHLSGQKDYALANKIGETKSYTYRKELIFIDQSVVDNQLVSLLDQLNKLEPLDLRVTTMEKREQQQAILQTEQVIGRVARILNRPYDLTQEQKKLYLDNLQETLKLAETLSIHENTWTWRKIGRLLMGIAAAAAITAIVSFFVFSTAPIAITVAVCSALLGGLGLYLQQFSNAASLNETLSDVVHNVKLFPADVEVDVVLFSEDGNELDDSGSDDDNPQNGCRLFMRRFDKYLEESEIGDYLKSKVFSQQYYLDRYITELTEKIKSGLEQRLDSQDNENELHDQLSIDSSVEQLVASSGIEIIPMDNGVVFASVEELMADGGLDPLGSANPEKALKSAHQTLVAKIEAQHTSPMTHITNAVNAVFSFFGSTDRESASDTVINSSKRDKENQRFL